MKKSAEKLAKNFAKIYETHTTIFSVGIIILLTIFANFAYVFITNPDPLIMRSGLPTTETKTGEKFIGINSNLKTGFVSGAFYNGNTIEPNDGMTKQALGKQAANQVSRGEFPLWNNYEAVGAPLLGETQSAALFPLTLLFNLPNGFLIFQIILEAIGGIGMYLFLSKFFAKKDKKINNLIAITAGFLYATLGTYAMLSNACSNPIAFLPWQMFAILLIFENPATKIRDIFSRKNIGAMLIFALSIIFAMNSGFPETAVLNLILVVIFALILFIKTPKKEKFAKLFALILPILLSILVSLPWLLEFANYLKNGFLGGHGGTFAGDLGSGASTWLASFVPNIIGFNTPNPTFGSIGGYFTLSVVILAVFALTDKNIKLWQKLLFGGWFVIGWARIIGVPVITDIIGHIPLIGSAAVYRYIQPSMSFVLIILAAFGISRIIREKVSRKLVLIVSGILAIFYLIILFGSRAQIIDFLTAGKTPLDGALCAFWFVAFLAISVLAVLAILIISRINFKWKKYFLCFGLILEAFVIFAVWQFGAPRRSVEIDTRAMTFLQKNIGNSSFASNFIIPNYGSYFNARQIDINDLPVPKLWCDYIKNNDRNAAAECLSTAPSFSEKEISEDKKLGVKYFAVVKNSLSEKIISDEKLKLVYKDEAVQIFVNPNSREYLSGEKCEISGNGFAKFTANCSENSELTRLEVFYPGWHAEIDGEEVDIQKAENLFQKIAISEGKHEVEFYYWPKFMTISVVFSAVGILIICAGGIYFAVSKNFSQKRRKNEKIN